MLTDKIEQAVWLRELAQHLKDWDYTTDEYLGDNPFSKFVFTAEASSWDDFVNWHESLPSNWGFRGQGNAEWFLHPTLDRAVEVSGEGEGYSFVTHVDRGVAEDRLLFRFKQQANRHLRHLPDDDNIVSWLALMQHHGAPTRLLDWTKSPYVAAYFAFEAHRSNKCAIWAIDLQWLQERGSRILQSQGKRSIPSSLLERATYVNCLLREPEGDERDPAKMAMVIEVEPSRTDAWMNSQQGFFLCKLLSRVSFNQLLMSMMMHRGLIEYPVVRKLELSTELRIEFLKRLRRANIHRGALFPDLDGFSRFLGMDWEIDCDDIRARMQKRAEGDPLADENDIESSDGFIARE